jgi:hypothetical protein
VFFVVLQIGFAFAQNKTGILGTVLDAKTQRPLAYVVVSIQNTNVMQLTAIDGKFNFDDLVGVINWCFSQSGYKDALFPVTIEIGQLLDLGMIMLEEDEILDQQRSLIRLFENELTDDNSGSESTSDYCSPPEMLFSKLPLSIGVRHVSGFGDW